MSLGAIHELTPLLGGLNTPYPTPRNPKPPNRARARHRAARAGPARLTQDSQTAHRTQSRPDSGLGSQVKVLETFQVCPSSLGSGLPTSTPNHHHRGSETRTNPKTSNLRPNPHPPNRARARLRAARAQHATNWGGRTLHKVSLLHTQTVIDCVVGTCVLGSKPNFAQSRFWESAVERFWHGIAVHGLLEVENAL